MIGWNLDGCAVGGQGIARGDNPDELRLLLKLAVGYCLEPGEQKVM